MMNFLELWAKRNGTVQCQENFAFILRNLLEQVQKNDELIDAHDVDVDDRCEFKVSASQMQAVLQSASFNSSPVSTTLLAQIAIASMHRSEQQLQAKHEHRHSPAAARRCLQCSPNLAAYQTPQTPQSGFLTPARDAPQLRFAHRRVLDYLRSHTCENSGSKKKKNTKKK